MRLPPSFLVLAMLCLAQLSAEVATPPQAPKDQAIPAVDDDLWAVQTQDWTHAASYDLSQSAPPPLPLPLPSSPSSPSPVNSPSPSPSPLPVNSSSPSQNIQAEGSGLQSVADLAAPTASPGKTEVEEAPIEDYTNLSSTQEGGTVSGVKGIQRSLQDDTFSLDFADEPIRNVIRYIADVYTLNVVIPENLSGNVSLKLKDVNWPEVFKAVLDPAGFSYIQEGKIIKIKSLEDVKSELMETRIFPLKFSDANAVLGSISPLVDPALGGRILADTRTNVLIITERPTRLRELELVVGRLDEAESQVMIETKIAEIKRTKGEKRGIDWSVLNGYAMSVGNPAGVPVSDYPAGINRTFIPKDSSYSREETIIFNASQFRLILNALDSDDQVNLVASPNVVTMNNTKANINIARKVPVPNYSYNQQTGTFEVSGFNYENIGVILDVTPKAQQNFITLDIKPELSDSSENIQFGSDTSASKALIPIINTRRTQSIVTIESGYTLALGGLMKEGDNEKTTKLPIIGNMPGPIGKLFSSTSKTKEKTNLIIFVTATRIGFNGEPFVPFKGNIPGNIDLRVLDDILYTERDMPGAPVSEEEKKAIEAARMLRKQKEENLYLQTLEAKMLKEEGKTQKDDDPLGQEGSKAPTAPIASAPQVSQPAAPSGYAEPSAHTQLSSNPEEATSIKPIKRDLRAPRI